MDGRIRIARVLVRDVLHEQQGEDAILVLWASKVANSAGSVLGGAGVIDRVEINLRAGAGRSRSFHFLGEFATLRVVVFTAVN